MVRLATGGGLAGYRTPVLLAGLAIGLGLALAVLPQDQLLALGALALAAIAIAAIFAEPALGLALAMAAGPFQPLERVALQLPIDSGQAILAIAFLAYGARWLATRQAPMITLRSPIIAAVGAFLGIALISFFPARDLGEWANECAKWLQLLAIAILVGNERDPRKRALVLGAILLSAAGQAVYGIVQADIRGFGPREFRVLGSETRYRAYGTFEQPNPFGGYMGLAWPVAAALAVYFGLSAFGARWRAPQPSDERRTANALIAFACAVTAVLCLIALSASGSRGALVGAGAAALAMVLVVLRRPWRWVGLVAVIAFLLFASNRLDVIPAGVRGQVETLVNDYASLDVRDAHITPVTFSVIERLAHWQAAVRMAEAHPWLGVGFGNYAAAYPDFRLVLWENALGHAHNYYLNLLAEVGALGLLAYLGMWLTIVVATVRLARAGAADRRPVSGQLQRAQGWLAAMPRTAAAALAVGILGAWAHLAAHHLFDKLYVANMHMLIGAYLGLLVAVRLDPMPRTSRSELAAGPAPHVARSPA